MSQPPSFSHSFEQPHTLASMMATSKPKPSFLSLPYELREQIYELTVRNDDVAFNTYEHNPPLHSLLLTSRKISEEYSKFYYSNNIFHLHIRRGTDLDHITPDTSGLSEWRTRSSRMRDSIREVMLHFDISFRSKIPDADRCEPTSLSWLAAGLKMAPNLEILHLVLFCSSQPFSFTDSDDKMDLELPAFRSTTTKPVELSPVNKRVCRVLPLISELSNHTTFPNLSRIIIHVDVRHGYSTVPFFADNVTAFEIEWNKSESRSFVSCENKGYCGGHNSEFSEHTFHRYDRDVVGDFKCHCRGKDMLIV
jgi:hypothetical protein